jgi:acyl-CoA thioester hydrolase
MKLYVNETGIKVRYAETDQMGVVYHSNYLIWFEVGRTEFISSSGMSYSDMEKSNIMIPVIEVNCKYTGSAKYEDKIIVKTCIKELSPAKIIFEYNVLRECDGKIIVKGSTAHVFVNKDFKIINMKKKHLEIWERLEKLSLE